MQAQFERFYEWRQRSINSWNRFWFAPADPTVFGVMRICTGLIVLYTTVVYTLTLQDFLGKDGWYALDTHLRRIREQPYALETQLNGEESQRVGLPQNKFEKAHLDAYIDKWGNRPPAPYPANDVQEAYIDEFMMRFGLQDPRRFNLPLPTNDEEREYLEDYTRRRGQPPPVRYPKDEAEAKAIEEYIDYFGYDPRRVYHTGSPVWSLWFHLTDPTGMMIAHLAICLIMLLFTLGFCTRITSVLAWMASLFYTHRAPLALFGFDTMTNIVLVYLMIAPSGAAYSLDRLIGRWWSTARPRVINRWRRLWGLPAVEIAVVPFPEAPPPLVSANFALRLMQVHICIIYAAAGLSKLLGQAWWRGNAIWLVLANYEFAPMEYAVYQEMLRLIAHNRLVFDLVITGGSYFTLFFEISYPYLIWRRSTRWLMLAMAILLHGFIGVFMGLRTFSLMMLVMNMCFLRPNEARWIMSMFSPQLGGRR